MSEAGVDLLLPVLRSSPRLCLSEELWYRLFPWEGVPSDGLLVGEVPAGFHSGFNRSCPRKSESTTHMREVPFRAVIWKVL